MNKCFALDRSPTLCTNGVISIIIGIACTFLIVTTFEPASRGWKLFMFTTGMFWGAFQLLWLIGAFTPGGAGYDIVSPLGGPLRSAGRALAAPFRGGDRA
ncbi:triosephosphate isomerase [Pseudohyphozyma bogoriensis]|nr:triosephosphate isomerase [Pseudohyphozyma bogoriensis]